MNKWRFGGNLDCRERNLEIFARISQKLVDTTSWSSRISGRFLLATSSAPTAGRAQGQIFELQAGRAMIPFRILGRRRARGNDLAQ